MDISKKAGVSRPYIALFGPKKGDIETALGSSSSIMLYP
jgi:hypothetical protein